VKNQNIFKRSLSNASVCSLLFGIAVVGYGSPGLAQTESKTFYRETFQYCTASLGKPAADETGWLGLVTGLPKEKFSNLKVFSYGSSVVGNAVNSAPNGRAEGYSFWFKPTYGLSVLTTEFPFDVGLLSQYPSSVEYEQRLSGVDATGAFNKTQIVFLVDNDWYISGSAMQQSKPASWEPVKLDPSQLLYGKVPYVAGVGPAAPTAYNNSLPTTGVVRAFGIFMVEVNGRVRIDNFTLTTTGPIPTGMSTSVQTPSVALCPATSPDVTGVPVPTPTPDPDDSDGGIDRGTPEPLFPPGTRTPAPVPDGDAATFCSTSEQGAGLKVRVGKNSRKAFISKGISKNSAGLRDKALAHLFSSRVMPIGAAVNVRFGDYDQATGKIKVSLKKGATPTAIKLSRPVQGSLKRYIASLGGTISTSDPMFGSVAAGQSSVNSKSAACSAELKTALTLRAKAAGVSPRKIFVK
jgi:hypothetical protein